MKFIIALLIAALAATVSQPCKQAEQQREAAAPNTAAAQPAEVLIKFKPTALADSVQAFAAALGLEQVRNLPAIGVRVYRLPAGQSLDQVLARCRAHPLVEYAEPNLEYRIPERP
ncbi:MAG: hypothetical protein ONB48_17805 [candidate division KSB1 bacterium]|nr:hypothetical protein [candidate division KSB1 bacterium]MDZ7275332.1 hypothetical protein [candidate division KSB1 bacterium]MDZ7287499.1 hypothetical protein [candidate division KSB1 bacterium]MDZ7299613.1 hypothetical protein [candidate division KSB1 bacterium]MDZ7307406.1 hypothetical protein [candidate division KSB1 bacterium]